MSPLEKFDVNPSMKLLNKSANINKQRKKLIVYLGPIVEPPSVTVTGI
jgi:hypothetical protein